jgi:AmmeMemoRadiSam system protein B
MYMAGIVFGCIAPHPPLIIPGIGSERDRKVVSSTISAMEELATILDLSQPEATLIVSPHSYYIENMTMGISKAATATGDLNEWGMMTPKLNLKNDLNLVELIEKEATEAKIPVKSIGQKGYNLDHGVMVPLHFLCNAMKGMPVVPITFSMLSLKTHFAFGKAISTAAQKSQKRVAFIASGDLSHHLKDSGYGHDPMGEIFDERLAKALSLLDINTIINFDSKLVERAGECGLRSIVILLGALDGLKVKPRILSYEGPFGVGYLIAAFEVEQ